MRATTLIRACQYIESGFSREYILDATQAAGMIKLTRYLKLTRYRAIVDMKAAGLQAHVPPSPQLIGHCIMCHLPKGHPDCKAHG